MRIEYLRSMAGQSRSTMYLTTYLVNDSWVIDAGVLGTWETPARQTAITDVVLTHGHLDHIATLPMFLDNVYQRTPAPPRVHATESTHGTLSEHVFNGKVWADLAVMLSVDPPMLSLNTIRAGEPFTIGGVEVLPVPVSHTVPSLGFILTDELGSIAISSDTGPTDEFWAACRSAPNLQAVFLECSYPNGMEALAEVTCHLTPRLFEGELRKLGRPVRAIAMHLKPGKEEEIAGQLAELDFVSVEVVRPGEPYDFGG